MMQEFYRPGDPVGDILFNWLPLLGAIAIGIVGLFLISRGYRHYLNSAFLKRSGRPAYARVTKKWIEKGYANRSERHRTPPIKYYYLKYELRDDKRNFARQEAAPAELWDRVEIGDLVDVIAHPRMKLMRLSAWTKYRGKDAGAVQMAMGAVALSAAITTIISGAFDAMRPPEARQISADWVRDRAEVVQIGRPADPFLRIFSPGSRMIRVVFGDTHGGAFVANQRVVRVTSDQISAYEITDGAILEAWMDPADEYNAILHLEKMAD